MSSCCHSIARLIFAMGLAAIAYGAVFGFLPRDAKVVKTMFECVTGTVKSISGGITGKKFGKFPKLEDFVKCVKGENPSSSDSSTSTTTVTAADTNKNAFLINILFFVMVAFATIFLVLAIIFIILSFCCCCAGSPCIATIENIMLGLALPALLDVVCYVGASILLEKNVFKDNKIAEDALNIAGAYSGYIGVSLAAGWLITCLIGPVMTRNNSICMKMICMIIGLAAACGVYCAVVLADPKKVPKIDNNAATTTTTKDRLYPALIVAGAVGIDYVIMFFMCTFVTAGCCRGGSN